MFALRLLLLALVVRAQGPRRYRPTRDEWIQRQAESQGPHVCAVEKIPNSNRKFHDPWTNGYYCGLPTEIRFECCQGFQMLYDEPGCSLVKPMQNLVECVLGNGASAFAHGIIESGLEAPLSAEGPFTLFAPSNHAFLNASDELIALLNTKTAIRGGTPSILLYHLVPSRIFVEEMHDGMLLETFHYSQPLRINKLSTGLVTVNCVPMVAADLEATNGVVHKMENILRPPTHKTITDFLMRHPMVGRLVTLIVRSQMADELNNMESVTIFAPTDEAFARLPQEQIDAIANDTSIMKTLLMRHIVPSVWCSCFVAEKSSLVALDNEKLQFSCNATHTLVEGATILESDVVAGNGFIHFIDKVLLPVKVTSLRSIVEDLPILTFLQFLNTAAMDSVLRESSGKFTIFAPTDEAFDALSNETIQELLTNHGMLQDLIMSHLVPGEYTTNNVIHKQRLNTLKRKRRLRIRAHRRRFSVDGVAMSSTDHQGRNGVIHLVEQVLVQPDLSIADYLLSESSLSNFVVALNATSPSLLNVLGSTKGGPYTVFAPDDYAFSLLPPGHLQRLGQLPQLLDKLMGDHVVDDYYITSVMLPHMIYSLRTRSERILHLRDEDGVVNVEGCTIVLANVRCTNGVVHVINRLVQLQQQ